MSQNFTLMIPKANTNDGELEVRNGPQKLDSVLSEKICS